jgi:uncharacterized phage protein (TIGR01671 family)
MREIKFRAWDGSRSEWHYFVIAPNLENIDKTTSFGSAIHGYLFSEKLLDGDSWGQYTGLKDKNGAEIYEGDIVEAIAADPQYAEHDKRSDVVFNSRGGWQVREREGDIPYTHGLPIEWGGWRSIEVIGNIYENPELCTTK